MSDFDHTDTPAADDAEAVASAASVREIYAALAPDLLDEAEAEDAGPVVADDVLARQVVHGLLVTHDGARWLPRTLEAVAASDLALTSLASVDTGSTDQTATLVEQSAVVTATTSLPRQTGFPAAMAAAAALIPASARAATNQEHEWLWLLHDDCAPHPETLRRLLSAAIEDDAAVVGPKVLDWDGQRLLVELGLTISGSGRRDVGLEGREFDQGQHDDRSDVLAVGTAGMLVRRDVWDELGGLDPQIALFRDDVDFGWRAHLAGYRVVVAPHAIVEHAGASVHGRRRTGAISERAPLVDRRNAVHVMLANAGTWTFPLVVLRVILGSTLRSVGFVVGKVPGLAYDEVVAVSGALRPGRLRAARRWRRPQRQGGSVHGLRPTLGTQLRQGFENAGALVSGSSAGQDVPATRRRAAPMATLGGDEEEQAPVDDSLWARLTAWPGLVVVVTTLLVTLLAARALLAGGRLFGGALLPVPPESGDLWAAYLGGWQAVGLGSDVGSQPYLALLTGAAVPFLGSATATVSALVLLCIPLSAGSAWWALRGVTPSAWARMWAAVAYAAVLTASGAVAGGRVGTCAAAVLLPGLARAVLRALAPGAPLRLAWSAALVLAFTAAFAPITWPITVVTAAIGWLAWSRSLGSAARWLILAVVPPVLLLPWTLQWWERPELLVMEPGLTGQGAELSDPELAPWNPLLLTPGGPGSFPAGVLVAVPVLALLAVTLRPRSRGVWLAWVTALVGVAAAVATSRVAVSSPLEEGVAAGWPGPAVLVAALGMAAAVAAGADGVRAAARSRAVLAAVVVLALAAAVPAFALGLVRGLDDPLQRADPTVLPVYVADEAAGPDRIRTLVLRTEGDDDDRSLRYTVLRDHEARMGDAEVSDPASQEQLGVVVGDLVAGRGNDSAERLAAFGIRYVYTPSPADPAAVETLDGQPGLVRASAPDGAAIWRVVGTTARVRLLTDAQSAREPVGVTVPSDELLVDATIDTPQASKLLLAEDANPGWVATLDDEELLQVSDPDGMTAFALPSGSGRLRVQFEDPQRQRLLVVQGVALVAVVVLLVPSLRGRRDVLEGEQP